uniref:Uncharacterized protein n=1 Tax=Oryzias sinensis TaxID=183150 RepID=A0A8C8A217_9TELE
MLPRLCLFAPLESLNLYHNCIKCIPEAIINLQMLTYLDISSLERDISCFAEARLPMPLFAVLKVGQSFIFLHSRNLLSVLPKYLFNLPLKVLLDFSCNKITEIPPAYRKLSQLQTIILDNNPMQSPPAQVCGFTIRLCLCFQTWIKRGTLFCSNCKSSACGHSLCVFVCSDLPKGKSSHFQVSKHPSLQDRKEARHSGPPNSWKTLSPTALPDRQVRAALIKFMF